MKVDSSTSVVYDISSNRNRGRGTRGKEVYRVYDGSIKTYNHNGEGPDDYKLCIVD